MHILKDKKIVLPNSAKLAFCGNINLTLWSPKTIQEQIAARDQNVSITFAKGYSSDDYIDEALLNEAQRKAQAADIGILLVMTETEKLSKNQHQLIRSVSLVQRNLIVLLYSTTITWMPWEKEVRIILQTDERDDFEKIIDWLFEHQQ